MAGRTALLLRFSLFWATYSTGGGCSCEHGWAGLNCSIDVSSLFASPPSPPLFLDECAAEARARWVAHGDGAAEATRAMQCSTNSECVARSIECARARARASLPVNATEALCKALCSDGRCVSRASDCPPLASCPRFAPKRCLDGSCMALSGECAQPDPHELCARSRAPTGGSSSRKWGGGAGTAIFDALLDANGGARLCADGRCVPVSAPCVAHDGCSPVGEDDGLRSPSEGGGVVRCDDGSCVSYFKLLELGPAAISRCSAAAAAGGEGDSSAAARAALAAAFERGGGESPPPQALARASALRVRGHAVQLWLRAPAQLGDSELQNNLSTTPASGLLNTSAPDDSADDDNSELPGPSTSVVAPLPIDAWVHGRLQLARVGALRLSRGGDGLALELGALFASPPLVAGDARLWATVVSVGPAPPQSELRAGTWPARWSRLGQELGVAFAWAFEDLVLSPVVSLALPALSPLGATQTGAAEAADAAALPAGIFLELLASTREASALAGALGGRVAHSAVVSASAFARDATSGAAVGVCLGALEGLEGTLGAWRCIAPAAVVSVGAHLFTDGWVSSDGTSAQSPLAAFAVDGARLEVALLRARVPLGGARAYAFIAHDGTPPFSSFRASSSPPPPPAAPGAAAGPAFANSALWLAGREYAVFVCVGVAFLLCCCCALESRLQDRRRRRFWAWLKVYVAPLSQLDQRIQIERFGFGKQAGLPQSERSADTDQGAGTPRTIGGLRANSLIPLSLAARAASSDGSGFRRLTPLLHGGAASPRASEQSSEETETADSVSDAPVRASEGIRSLAGWNSSRLLSVAPAQIAPSPIGSVAARNAR